MTRYRGWILLGLGLFLALGAGVMTFFVLQQQRTSAEEESRRTALQALQIPTTRLPVAAHTLEPGVILGAADYVLKDFPTDLVPASAITQTESLQSQIITQAIVQGETFRSDKFLGSTGATMSQQIKPGKVLVAFPIIDLLSQSDLVHEGDRVDLLLTIAAQKEEQSKTSAFTLQNIEVFKILRPAGDDAKEKAATALLCSMSPEDALMLKFIKDSGGTIDFVLRSALDAQPHTVPAITMQELTQRYLAR